MLPSKRRDAEYGLISTQPTCDTFATQKTDLHGKLLQLSQQTLMRYALSFA